MLNLQFYPDMQFLQKLAMVLLIALICSCASQYKPEHLDWKKVKPANPQSIDGEWKNQYGVKYHFENGKGRFLNSSSIDPFNVAFKNIQRVGPGKFTMESLSWNSKSKKTDYGKAEIVLINARKMVILIHANPLTKLKERKYTLETIRLKNPDNYAQELKEKRIKEEFLVWEAAQKNQTVSSYWNFVRMHPNNHFTPQVKAWLDSYFQKKSAISDDEKKNIISVVTARIAPFSLSDLYDKSMFKSGSLGNRQEFGMKTSTSNGISTSIITTKAGSIISKRQPRLVKGKEITVTLQGFPVPRKLRVFYEKAGSKKTASQLNITAPGKQEGKGLIYSEILIENYRSPGKPYNVICPEKNGDSIDKCYDTSSKPTTPIRLNE